MRSRTPTVQELAEQSRDDWENICAALMALEEGANKVEDRHGKGNGLDGWKRNNKGIVGYQYRRYDDRFGASQAAKLKANIELAKTKVPQELGLPLVQVIFLPNIDLEPGHRGSEGEIERFEVLRKWALTEGIELEHRGVTVTHALLCKHSHIRPELFEDLSKKLDEQDQKLDAQSDMLRQLVDNVATATASVDLYRSGAPPFPTNECFFGHDANLIRLIELMDANAIVQILGLPGTGKTTLAIESVRRASRGERALWLVCKGHIELEQFLVHIAAFIDSHDAKLQTLKVLQQPQLSISQKIEAVLLSAESLGATIILDGINDLGDDLFLPFLEQAPHFLRRSCLILTAIDDVLTPRSIFAPSVRLTRVDDVAAISMLFFFLKKGGVRSITNSQATAIAANTHGHPWIIKLAASLLETLPPDALIAELKTFTEDTTRRITSRALSDLEQRHLELLNYLSCFVLPFDHSAISSAAEMVARPEAAFLDLLRKSLIEVRGQGQFVVHSIIVADLAQRMSSDAHLRYSRHIISYYKTLPRPLKADEWVLLIEMNLIVGEPESAKPLIDRFVSHLTGQHLYTLALDYLNEWMGNDALASWDLGHFTQGRLLRITGSIKDAMRAYRKAVSESAGDPRGELHSAAQGELAACLVIDDKSESAHDEAKKIYQMLAGSEDLSRRAMSIMALCTISSDEEKVEYIPQLEALASSFHEEPDRGTILKVQAVLGEALLNLPKRRQEGLQMIRAAASSMLERGDRGHFILALRHYLDVLMENFEENGDFNLAADAGLNLISVSRWTGDVHLLLGSLFTTATLCCVSSQYAVAVSLLSELMKVTAASGEPATRVLRAQASAWMAIALWNVGAHRTSVAARVYHAHLCSELGIKLCSFGYAEMTETVPLDDQDHYARQFIMRVSGNEQMQQVLKWGDESWQEIESGAFDMNAALQREPMAAG